MKQKIVLEVHMPCDKCRKKARKIAALTEGLMFMSIDTDKNQLVVEGVGIDAAILTTSLRKKVGRTTIKSVEEVKPKDDKGSAKKSNVPCSYNDAVPLYPGYEVRYKIGCFPNS